jgi:foldase protein PrsA
MKTRALAAVAAVAAAAAVAAVGMAAARAEEPVAMVNGQPIERAALVERLLDESTLGLQMLDQLISETLLEQEAKKKGVAVTDQEVQARMEQMRKGRSEDDFKRYLAENHLRDKGLERAVRTKLLADKLFGGQVQVTDDDAQRFYDANKGLFSAPAMAALRVMLLGTQDEAKAVLERLGKGESFESLAKAMSRDIPTRAQGGLVGPAPREALDQLFPGAGDVAFGTDVGAVSVPIQKPDGWWLVKVEARTAATAQSFDQAKAGILQDLKDARLNQAYRAWLLKVLQDPATKIDRQL